MEKLTYKVEDINKVLNYLGNKPYVEVAALIQVLQSGETQAAEDKPDIEPDNV